MVDIYVLECENNKYYIGKTKNCIKRINNHFKGNATAWTAMHHPIRLIETIPNCDSFDEDKITKKYMAKYGIDSTRGGSYVTIKLDEKTKNFLRHEFITAEDRCYGCGSTGHFVRNCNHKCRCNCNKHKCNCSKYNFYIINAILIIFWTIILHTYYM